MSSSLRARRSSASERGRGVDDVRREDVVDPERFVAIRTNLRQWEAIGRTGDGHRP